MSGDRLELLTLHGLRLVGMATGEAIADVHGLDPVTVEAELERLNGEGLVAPARGDTDRWTLLRPGRKRGERLLARQLDNQDPAAQAVVQGAYDRFTALNQPMLDVCTRWQIVSSEPLVLNDHSDPAYDAAVVDDLTEIDSTVQPICAQLESVFTRFGRYGPAFSEALSQLRRGRYDWLTKPTILSYHTVWFQLHEDLLATLGLERAAETARLNDAPGTEASRANPRFQPEPPAGTVLPAHHDSPKD